MRFTRYDVLYPIVGRPIYVKMDQREYAHLQTAKHIRNAIVHNENQDPRIEVRCYDQDYSFVESFRNPTFSIPKKGKK